MTHVGKLTGAGLALAAALVALPAPAFPPAPAGSKDEKVVFTTVAADEKKVAIGVMNADGSGRTILTKEGLEIDPALSPDGKRIAFATIDKDNKQGEVWVMSADGSGRKKLTDNMAGTSSVGPCWSPDGKKIACSQMTEAPTGPPTDADLIVMDADGKNAKSVGKGLMPAFSPDGKKILYSVIEKGGDFEPRLYVMDADGKNAKELVKGRGLLGAWSPDGKTIAYTGAPEGRNPKPQVYVCNADGSDPKPLTKGDDQAALAPRWSADGKRIYFNRMQMKGRPQKAGIYVMDADGSNEKELSKSEGMDLLGGAPLFLLGRSRAVEKP